MFTVGSAFPESWEAGATLAVFERRRMNGKGPGVLTPDDQRDFFHLLESVGNRENVILDFSDERQFRSALAIHNLGGHTPESRPGMHMALAERRERHILRNGAGGEQLPQDPPFETGAWVDEISRVTGTPLVAASGFSSVVGGAFQLNSTIALFNSQDKALLASGSGTQFNEGRPLDLYAEPLPDQHPQPQVTATIFYSYQQNPGDPWVTALTQRSIDVGVGVAPEVTHPNRHQSAVTSEYIRIALGRGANNQNDVDYWYWYHTDSTTYALPWYGSVTLPARPRALVYGVNPVIFGRLRHGKGGTGGCAELPEASKRNIFDNLHVSGNTLSWTLTPPSDQPPWDSMGNPLKWGDLKWVSGEADYLSLQLVIYLEDQTVPATATVQSADGPSPALDGVTYIPPIQFLWSCMVAGTPVLLADGSTIRIEDVVRGSVVQCGDGLARRVSSTTIFRFSGDVVRLLTEDGSEVALSGNHPVVTADGIVQAHELEPGVALRVRTGTAVLRRADREPYEGLLCNLRLTESAEPDPVESTVFAGGIEVGDYALQTSHDYAHRTDPDRILAMLDPRYHPDFENHLNETTAAADRR
ncbi:Hint domain-containing protein [Streptomyces spirodelae]|uniref:Hint domain-containing protein n=1 Tax=Streptomyces spirodelae TaxID=2812904 RepID=A0ABS3WTE7_9ACTN|nr:Hint domain-containing protein [Streptomyces spirodelae]MBO8186406.1 hypothetical protein [Streptomyces spirodelae]